MSKYIDQLVSQLKGKNIDAFTKEIQSSRNITKILREQQEKEKRARANKDIQRILRGL